MVLSKVAPSPPDLCRFTTSGNIFENEIAELEQGVIQLNGIIVGNF
ncbi:Uncharacterised protein [Klebsiella grimontii]|uniref:Uncharacterized protein n=1 Tax=Klebsiella grimontii TaxID=2058152 RepID=A0A7H4P5B3_9ENTR|nr:Uncharacterised protein [Klebsiella grimontii]